MKKQASLEPPCRALDDLRLSHSIACIAHSVARAAQRELDLALATLYLGTPPPEDHLVEVEKHWLEARALAESAREAYARARLRHAKLHPQRPRSGTRRSAA